MCGFHFPDFFIFSCKIKSCDTRHEGKHEMKFFTLLTTIFTLTLFTATTALSADIPFNEEQALRFSKVERYSKKAVHGVWDVSANSTQGSSTTNSGSQTLLSTLPPTLPANSVITNSWFYVETQPVRARTDPSSTAAQSLVAFQCEDSGNLVAAFNPTNHVAGVFYHGKQQGQSTITFSAQAGGIQGASTIGTYTGSIAAACDIKAVVTNDNFTAGKIHLFVEFLTLDQ
jgi:hypothetical protein